MITEADRLRLQTLFTDTISLLCRSGLPVGSARRVDALIGVTLESNEVVLLNVNESFVVERKSQNRPTETLPCHNDVKTEMYDDMDCKSEVTDAHDLSSTDIMGPYTVHTNAAVANVTLPKLANASGYTSVKCTMDDRQINNIADGLNAGEDDDDDDNDVVLIKAELPEVSTERSDPDWMKSGGSSASSSTDSSLLSVSMKPQPKVRQNMCQSQYKGQLQSRGFASRPFNHQAQKMVKHYAMPKTMMSANGGQESLKVSQQLINSQLQNTKFVSKEFLQCHVCGSWYRGHQTLVEHIRGVHLAIHSYRCDDCGLTFKWRASLKKHRTTCAVPQRRREISHNEQFGEFGE